MSSKLDYMVFIGRFQPPHLAHIEIIKKAMSLAHNVIVLVGSANQPRTTKNPFTWQERELMIRSCFNANENSTLHVKPLRDKMYNDQAWIQQVQDVVSAQTKDHLDAKIGIIGYTKDESSYYLNMFPQWKLINVDNIDDLHATDIREAMFRSNGDVGSFDAILGRFIPAGIHDVLMAFMVSSTFEALADEFAFIEQYKQSWSVAPYPPTFVTVDAVVVQSGHVLLVRRRAEPGKGTWALPGGFINENERLVDGMIRELREETKLKVPVPVLKGSIKKTEVFDHPSRSTRGRTITHAYLIELDGTELPKVKGGDDADKAKWIPLSAFSQMEDQVFEDHYFIVNHLIGN